MGIFKSFSRSLDALGKIIKTEKKHVNFEGYNLDTVKIMFHYLKKILDVLLETTKFVTTSHWIECNEFKIFLIRFFK